MTEKNDALRLADDRPTSVNDDLYQWAIDAETELRRLHAELAESEKWRDRDEARAANAERERDIAEAQRDALLEALVKCRDRFFPADQPEQDRDELWGPVNAAIKNAEGENT